MSILADNDNVRSLTYLSVCSGIEAATAAWHQLGWRAVAYSEIEKFPSAVLAHHYPDVPNLGDFTKIATKRLGRVDILAGGTPCQAFSVAGLRQSLADARGNLSLEFVRLAHELADGNGLRNVVWENVVGVLSTKDNAFGCFLAGLVGADYPISPPARGKWPRHGMVSGPKGRAAWAVKDAQFFGVAQRRRRVIVVADFGNGADPAAVLFEPEGVFRHPPTRGEAGQDVAGTVAGGARKGGWPADVAPTLNAAFGDKQGLEDQHALNGAGLFVPQAVGVHGSISHTLKAEGADASEDGTGRGTPIVALAHETGQGWWKEEDVAGTLRAEGENRPSRPSHVIAQTVALRGRDGGATAELGGSVATALRASQGGGDKPHVLTTAVRRLTPMECERLQGFPDGFTRIPMRTYATKKVTRTRPDDMWEFIDGEWWLMASDGPRYKALGNSWAVPKFVWLGKRIAFLMPNQ